MSFAGFCNEPILNLRCKVVITFYQNINIFLQLVLCTEYRVKVCSINLKLELLFKLLMKLSAAKISNIEI